MLPALASKCLALTRVALARLGPRQAFPRDANKAKRGLRPRRPKSLGMTDAHELTSLPRLARKDQAMT